MVKASHSKKIQVVKLTLHCLGLPTQTIQWLLWITIPILELVSLSGPPLPVLWSLSHYENWSRARRWFGYRRVVLNHNDFIAHPCVLWNGQLSCSWLGRCLHHRCRNPGGGGGGGRGGQGPPNILPSRLINICTAQITTIVVYITFGPPQNGIASYAMVCTKYKRSFCVYHSR